MQINAINKDKVGVPLFVCRPALSKSKGELFMDLYFPRLYNYTAECSKNSVKKAATSQQNLQLHRV
jgi:hypothetical protein